ncbi:site-specific recombinase XerD [Desulfosporosinus acidiphilus SJ4]|uniref:Site-specific recombinase XerD n=1 Tax=Desulfosporosinus acidiphilus (strain DSM 22704 / JCM 16185 / SJ4) TaxID=646529 RepID=I4D827_DESAJ|nr:tyrosine-type recombinase/integrase [Desulfosporosinus acidiphilus]AFM41951.1 site-specific recombinase XerD [Desulfosporosinus acidiphilus SJ4]
MASIKKRGENSYQITVSCGYDGTGKKIVKTKTITLESSLTAKQIDKEVQKQAVLFEKEVEDGTYLDGGKLTFAEFTERWIKDYAEKQLQPKTFLRYKDMLDSRILPAIGHIKLQKLQPNHLLQFYNNLEEDGIRLDIKYSVKPEFNELMKQRGLRIVDLSRSAKVGTETIRRIRSGSSITAKTAEKLCKTLNVKMDTLFIKEEVGHLSGQSIKHHHRLISSILTNAVQWQCILNNPAARVKPPKVEKTEASHFDEEMTEHMLTLLEEEPLKYKTMIYLAVYSGSRLGEVAGLEWSDVDFENNLLRICRASQYLPGKGTFTKSPKNDSSQRIITMPPLVMDLLKEYKAWQNEERLKCGDQWQDHDRLFTQWNGKPIFPSTPTIWFKDFRRKHDLPDVKFHGLRHTNASLLIGHGVDVQTVAKRLGHTKATTTTSVYSHFLRKPDTEAADKLQNLFSNKKDTSKQA